MRINNKGLSELANCRFMQHGKRVLLTNDIGEYIYLTPVQFDLLADGRLEKQAPDKFLELIHKNFIRKRINLQLLVNRFAQKHFVGKGVDLHIVILTLRCDHKCVYCHASAVPIDSKGFDMGLLTARKVVDRIFESPSKAITIEFQGGEPLLNFKALQFIVRYALQKNKKAKKVMTFSVVTNLTFMDEKKLSFLAKSGVHVCSSLDGPARLHDTQRKHPGNGSYRRTVMWLRKLSDESDKRPGYPKPNALVTVTRSSLNYPRQIIDEYRSLGMSNIHLRWVNPFGMSVHSWDKIKYSPQQFLSFYYKALDYILELNKRGIHFTERGAVTFLQKIFLVNDPNFLDLRSPCGAGIGQLAYNYNGDVYTCDEGRMLSRMNDESFKVGSVSVQSYEDYISNPVVQTVCTASCLDVIPGCSECVFKPYCGTCPVYNYKVHGDLCRNAVFTCEIKKGILTHLFKKMEDPKNKEIFFKWIGVREAA